MITLETRIRAPIDRCFDLSRDIDLHMRSTQQTREVAVAGVTTGLIGPGEEVTWEATHFGVRQRLTSRITAYKRPGHFRDSQTRGAFKRFDHDHFFGEITSGETLMRDVFEYESPFGCLGTLADWLFLERYMTSLLERRNPRVSDSKRLLPSGSLIRALVNRLSSSLMVNPALVPPNGIDSKASSTAGARKSRRRLTSPGRTERRDGPRSALLNGAWTERNKVTAAIAFQPVMWRR